MLHRANRSWRLAWSHSFAFLDRRENSREALADSQAIWWCRKRVRAHLRTEHPHENKAAVACGTHTGSRISACTGIRPCARIQNFGPPEEAPTAVCLCALQCRLLAPAVSCQAGRRSCSSLAVHGAVGEAACAGCAAAQGATIPAKHLGWEFSRARPCDMAAARCASCRSLLQSPFQSADDGARYITKAQAQLSWGHVVDQGA